MKRFSIGILFLALSVVMPAFAFAKPKPQTSCTAASPTGASCSASCATGQATCWASATEAHCECNTGAPGPGRVWGPVGAIGTQQLLLCADFAAYLRTAGVASARTLALAADVDSTIAAVGALSQGRYALANDLYVDHEMVLTAVERDSIAAWRGRNNPFAKGVKGKLQSVAGAGVELSANVPNPFNTSTTISYALPTKATVRVAVYNAAGELVITLEAGEQNAGTYGLIWDGRDDHGLEVPSGSYFLRLTTDDAIRTRKMELVR